jgi:hypothetical protein
MDFSLRLLRLQDKVEWLEHQRFQNTSFRDTYESYEPLPRIDSYEQPPCLRSRFSEANRKCDLVCQRIMERAVATNHKLDEALGLLLSLPKKTIEEDLAEHDHIDQTDLGFMTNDFESQGTHDESFRQIEYKIIEGDTYDSDIEVEMPREAREILRRMLRIDSTKTHDEDIGDLDTWNDEVNNISPQNTQPSFEAHTQLVTYLEEVEETLGIPMEVEPLDQAPLEDIGLNTYSDNLTLSSREFPSVDEPEPQSLHNFPSLYIFLGDKRGTEPPINHYYPGSFRMKEAIHSPPSPHVAYFNPKGVYRYFHPHLILSVGKTSPISVK